MESFLIWFNNLPPDNYNLIVNQYFEKKHSELSLKENLQKINITEMEDLFEITGNNPLELSLFSFYAKENSEKSFEDKKNIYITKRGWEIRGGIQNFFIFFRAFEI